MKLSDIKKKAPLPTEPEKKTPDPAAASPVAAVKHDPKYPKKIALILIISHVIFALCITIWNFHIYILKPNSFGYMVYLLELPAAIIMKILNQTQNTESVVIYLAAFFINTIFYGFLGYLLGRVFQKYGWDKEIDLLSKMEAEAYEEKVEPKQI
jgi:hypothetical protein